MFPRDLAARAVEVIASVKQVFPARLDQVVAGPMLKLGWGRPVSFVTVSVGVVFTFPDPVVIAARTRDGAGQSGVRQAIAALKPRPP